MLVLHAHEFIHRFLQHVLPKGFMKVRYYGFLAPSSKIPLDQVELAIHLAHSFELPDKAASSSRSTTTGLSAMRRQAALLSTLAADLEASGHCDDDWTAWTLSGTLRRLLQQAEDQPAH